MAGTFNPSAPSVPTGVNSAAIPTSMVYADPSAAGSSAAVNDQNKKKYSTGDGSFNPAAAPVQQSQPAQPALPDAGGTVVRDYLPKSGIGDAAWRQNLATFSAGDLLPNVLPNQSWSPGFYFNPTAPTNAPLGISAWTEGGQPLGGGNAPLYGLPHTWLGQAQQNSAAQPQQPFDPNNWQSFLNFTGGQ